MVSLATTDKIWKKNVSEFGENTNFHGVKHLIEGTSKIRRLLWILLIGCAFCGLQYQLFKCITKYRSRPTNTKFSYQNKDELEFPGITICNMNMFAFEKISEQFGGILYFIDHGISSLRVLFPDAGLTETGKEAGYSIFDGNSSNYLFSDNLIEFIENNAPDISDTIVMCRFKQRDCNLTNFKPILTSYGFCFQFAVEDSDRWIKESGNDHGLNLILNAEESEYISAPRESIGFNLILHAATALPDSHTATQIQLSPGFRTAIAVRKHKKEILERSNDCNPDINYSQAQCFLDCEADEMYKRCGCKTFYVSGKENYPLCSPYSLTRCYNEQFVHFTESRFKLCPSCVQPCTTEEFSYSSSYSVFPSAIVPLTLENMENYEYSARGLGDEIWKEFLKSLDTIFARLTVIDVGVQKILDYLNTDLPIFKQIFKSFAKDTVSAIVRLLSNKVYYELYHINDITAEWGSAISIDVAAEIKNMSLLSGSDVQYWNSLDESIQFDQQTLTDTIIFTTSTFLNLFYNDTRDVTLATAENILSFRRGTDLAVDYMRSNLVKVEVFYKKLELETITEQEDYDVFSFICDIGGALGLFFGASLLTFLEALDFWCKKWQESKRSSQIAAVVEPAKQDETI
ncbi:acid-sensing ion channel 5-like [Antedon mediterranea]|uniref:acid-sensing ion channel 5-like n=1 Tax=Antedon mediterranea TaxID=105859 RepID=UPI003AF60C37